MQSFSHGLHSAADGNTGRLTGTRVHDTISFTKEFDKSTPYLYRAVANSETLQKGIIKWYRINSAGLELEFMNIIIENVKILSIAPSMHNIKGDWFQLAKPTESIQLIYEKITWKYLDGNIEFSDEWNTRAYA
jgi:type VI secretion system effector, Hcp1 family